MAVDLVIRMGQSNSLGNATYSPNASLDASFKTTFTNIKTWTGSAFASLDYSTNNNQFPVANQNAAGASEYAILKGLQEYRGTTIYDVKWAQGSTHLGVVTDPTTNWNTATRGTYLDAAISTINAAINNLWNTVGARSFNIFVVWIQGEADANEGTGVEAAAYQTNLTNLLDRIKAQFGTNITSCNFYPIIVRLNNNQTAWPYKATVKTAELNVANNYGTAYYVDTESYTLGADNVHYTNAGNKSIGEYIVNSIIIANNL
jgi:hypothetical protein